MFNAIIKERKKERKKENKVLIFAEAPFFPSLRHIPSVILIYVWLFGLHEKNIISPFKFVE